jgi:hypothetical protein
LPLREIKFKIINRLEPQKIDKCPLFQRLIAI